VWQSVLRRLVDGNSGSSLLRQQASGSDLVSFLRALAAWEQQEQRELQQQQVCSVWRIVVTKRACWPLPASLL
jgi:hypothetical protein